ncbi:sulfatase-like hydrolase/transferase [Rhabdochlamydiaceae symbiont of Dictyostelium giganteum]|uniref:sulfatase-like hydrolase/transferase n=1 Tax=Rhabdochlamydiaceae symbiont of Dictyostelium giganteum TaxID=3342349 RepID=UPI003850087E
MKGKLFLNIPYFATLFFLSWISIILHLRVIEELTLTTYLFYTLHAFCQLSLQWMPIMIITAWCMNKGYRCLGGVVACISFTLFILQLIDVPLMRFMDLSVWSAMMLYLHETPQNMIEFLRSSHISLYAWSLLSLSSLLTLGLGIYLFFLTEKKNHRALSLQTLCFYGGILGLLCGFLIVQEKKRSSLTIQNPKEAYLIQALPWKRTFIQKKSLHITVPGKFLPWENKKFDPGQLENLSLENKPLPNIYFFVIESLRDDYITEKLAPHLARFKQQSRSPTYAVAAANATPLSWFSLFHSKYPICWREKTASQESLGALPLQILKKVGYQIHVLSSSQLKFYQMDEGIFDRDHHIADSYQVFPDETGDEPSFIHDQKCFNTLIQSMQIHQRGHVFIIFLESTHFDYSAPLQHLNKPINYLKLLLFPKCVDEVKKRYETAIHYIDELMGRFFHQLDKSPQQKEAFVVITSDHGEEFFEEERLFHASHLNRFQTRIPLYYRKGSQKADAGVQMASHIDIFPTLLNDLFRPFPYPEWFEGKALDEQVSDDSYRLSARYQGGHSPREFLITTPIDTCIFRLLPSQDHATSQIEILSWKDSQQNALPLEPLRIQKRYQKILSEIFSPAK